VTNRQAQISLSDEKWLVDDAGGDDVDDVAEDERGGREVAASPVDGIPTPAPAAHAQ